MTKELYCILQNNNQKNHIKAPTRQEACLDLITNNLSNVIS